MVIVALHLHDDHLDTLLLTGLGYPCTYARWTSQYLHPSAVM